MLGSLNGMKITSIGGRSQYTGSVRTGKPTTRAVSFRDGSVPQKNDFVVHDTTKPNHQLILWYTIPQKGRSGPPACGMGYPHYNNIPYLLHNVEALKQADHIRLYEVINEPI